MKAILSILLNYFKKLDKQLFIVVFAVSMFSVLLMYSIVVNGIISYADSSFYLTQIKAVILGVACALILSAIDYHKLAKLWFLYMPICIIMVLLTFTGLGIQREGADDKAWLNLGFTSLQPSEILKFAFILSFAYHLSKVSDRMNKPLHLFLLCLHGIIPVLLIAAQGDHGTSIVFLMIFVFMIFAAGLSYKYIIAALVALPIFGVFLWFQILQPVHQKRILILFDPTLDPTTADQQRLGKIALGSGQLFGKGLFGGEYSYVPEAHNDFIFSYIGQTLGFVGCLLLVGALCYICLKIVINSRIAKDELGRNICIGAFALIFTHCIMNIGMVLGVMPVIGVPLPFTSNGGTAMLSMYIVIGLVLSTYSHSGKKYAVFYDAK